LLCFRRSLSAMSSGPASSSHLHHLAPRLPFCSLQQGQPFLSCWASASVCSASEKPSLAPSFGLSPLKVVDWRARSKGCPSASISLLCDVGCFKQLASTVQQDGFSSACCCTLFCPGPLRLPGAAQHSGQSLLQHLSAETTELIFSHIYRAFLLYGICECEYRR